MQQSVAGYLDKKPNGTEMGVLAGDAGDAFLLVKTVVAFAMPLY